MSFASSDNLGYLDTIQMFFLEVTQRSVFFSGRDVELLEEWRQQGATARAVCRGVRDAVDAMPTDDPPRDIYACRRWIEPYVEQARRRSAGRNDRSGDDEGGSQRAGGGDGANTSEGKTGGRNGGRQSGGLVEAVLQRIEEVGRECEREALREVYREAWRQVRRLEEVDDPGGRLEELAAIEDGLVEGYFRTLSRQQQRRVQEQITDESQDLLERMSGEARREHKLARCRRILIEEFGFVPLLE